MVTRSFLQEPLIAQNEGFSHWNFPLLKGLAPQILMEFATSKTFCSYPGHYQSLNHQPPFYFYMDEPAF